MVHSAEVQVAPLPVDNDQLAASRSCPISFKDLTQSEIALWTALLKKAQSASPFFAPEFSKAVDQVLGNVSVAFLGSGDDTAFLPFQRRKCFPTIADKVGGHMSDYFGIIGGSKGHFGEREILAASGLSVICFDHWPRTQCPVPPERRAESQGIKVVVESPETYFADLRKKDRKFVNEVERLERQVSESNGPTRFAWHAPQAKMELERLIDEKRKQYQLSGADDALSSDWSKNLLRTLLTTSSEDFEAIMSTLYCGDNWLASHFGLRYGSVLHVWFPVYNADFRRYGPGHMLLFKIIEHGLARGIREFDFGVGVASYKKKYGGSTYLVARGNLQACDLMSFAHKVAQSIKSRLQR